MCNLGGLGGLMSALQQHTEFAGMVVNNIHTNDSLARSAIDYPLIVATARPADAPPASAPKRRRSAAHSELVGPEIATTRARELGLRHSPQFLRGEEDPSYACTTVLSIHPMCIRRATIVVEPARKGDAEQCRPTVAASGPLPRRVEHARRLRSVVRGTVELP